MNDNQKPFNLGQSVFAMVNAMNSIWLAQYQLEASDRERRIYERSGSQVILPKERYDPDYDEHEARRIDRKIDERRGK